jgi:hypothetical protein
LALQQRNKPLYTERRERERERNLCKRERERAGREKKATELFPLAATKKTPSSTTREFRQLPK